MAGTSKERDPWKVAVGIYLYDPTIILRCDILDARIQEFELDVPELDWAQIVSDYQSPEGIALSNARKFVTAWHEVLRVMKSAKDNGSYTSTAWINGRGA